MFPKLVILSDALQLICKHYMEIENVFRKYNECLSHTSLSYHHLNELCALVVWWLE